MIIIKINDKHHQFWNPQSKYEHFPKKTPKTFFTDTSTDFDAKDPIRPNDATFDELLNAPLEDAMKLWSKGTKKNYARKINKDGAETAMDPSPFASCFLYFFLLFECFSFGCCRIFSRDREQQWHALARDVSVSRRLVNKKLAGKRERVYQFAWSFHFCWRYVHDLFVVGPFFDSRK